MSAIIENAIHCQFMDSKNITKMIEEYTVMTPLQEAFNRFCIEKSIPNRSACNETHIIEILVNHFSGEVTGQFVREYCSPEIQSELCETLLPQINMDNIDLKLLLSIEIVHAGFDMDDELKEYDPMFDRDTFEAEALLADATRIAIIVCCHNVQYRPLFEKDFAKDHRVWQTVIQVTIDLGLWEIDDDDMDMFEEEDEEFE